jgi:hypothetical protein
MAQLRALGARSVPIVSRGQEYVFAQVISDVVNFLELDEETGPVLSPEALTARLSKNLLAAIRFVRQMPDTELERELPNRPRSWRVLMHHVFQIPVAFLEFEESGKVMEYQNLVAPPPEDMVTSESIAAFGETVLARFDNWSARVVGESFSHNVPTYFGETSRHELLERTVWHSTQHTRQVASLLEQAGVDADRPLGPADIEGLPLTDTIWDEG